MPVPAECDCDDQYMYDDQGNVVLARYLRPDEVAGRYTGPITPVTTADLPRIRQRNLERENAERQRQIELRERARMEAQLEVEAIRQEAESLTAQTCAPSPIGSLPRAWQLNSPEGE